MHGRIFVIDTYKGIQYRGGLYELPWEPWEMREWIPGCDYVTESEDFEKDCEWFKQYFHISDDQCSFVNLKDVDGETPAVFEVSVEPVLSTLREYKKRRLEEIKREIQKDDPDMWKIRWLAWDSGFLFVWEQSLDTEMGFLEYLQRLKKENTEKILVIQSYDYHY